MKALTKEKDYKEAIVQRDKLARRLRQIAQMIETTPSELA